MSKTGVQGTVGIAQWMLSEAFVKCFHRDSAAMADALQLPEDDIQKALERRLSPEVFERLVAYCLRNKISLDGLMYRYPD